MPTLDTGIVVGVAVQLFKPPSWPKSRKYIIQLQYHLLIHKSVCMSAILKLRRMEWAITVDVEMQYFIYFVPTRTVYGQRNTVTVYLTAGLFTCLNIFKHALNYEVEFARTTLNLKTNPG